MDYFKSRLGWAMSKVKEYQTSEPKPDSKAYWQWRTAALEWAAIDNNCRETGAMPIFALQPVQTSEVDRDQYMEAIYADITHVSNWPVAASALRRMHPALTGLLRLLTLNTYDASKKRKRTKLRGYSSSRRPAQQGTRSSLQKRPVPAAKAAVAKQRPIFDCPEINCCVPTGAEQGLLEGRKCAEATHVVLLDAQLCARDD